MSIGQHLLAGPNTSARYASAPSPEPPVSPLWHLMQAENDLRQAAEASISQWPTGRTARILELLRQVENARRAME